MQVFITVDVEVWCDGWEQLDERFPDAFRRYVYGPTPEGEFGLRTQLQVLRDAGLQAVFFVEPLFALRFGLPALTEIVGLVLEAGQDVQLHLHPEWVGEAQPPPVPPGPERRPLMRQFSREHQRTLIQTGARLLQQAGAPAPRCFRAGSFGFNHDTLLALADCGLTHDSSYNATLFGPDSGLAPGQLLQDAFLGGPVAELPMTVFDDGFGRLRHAQLGACSSAELELLMWRALEQQRQSFVILSHNFELLTPSKHRHDPVVQRRFLSLCRFLERHSDKLPTASFQQSPLLAERPQPTLLKTGRWTTARRVAEQAWRRRYA